MFPSFREGGIRSAIYWLFSFRLQLVILAVLGLAEHSRAQTFNFTSVPDGYVAGTIELPREFAGAFGVDPGNANIVYVAIGAFGDMNLARIDLAEQSSEIVATGPFGGIGGIAVLSHNQLVIIDNAGAEGGPPDDTILLATDRNHNGSFDETGEIKQLIAPILTGDWTGSQARVAPKGKLSRIAPGSVVIQTADGNGEAELLVISNPLRGPRFEPRHGAYFSGFDYNGGFDFDSRGRIIMGTLTSSFTGDVYALIDRNSNRKIDPHESNRIVSGENGMSDLIVAPDDHVYFTGFDESFVAAVRTFPVPVHPLTETATPQDFAATDAGFLSGLILNTKTHSFAPDSGPHAAVMLIGGFDADFAAATNILTLTPSSGTGQ